MFALVLFSIARELGIGRGATPGELAKSDLMDAVITFINTREVTAVYVCDCSSTRWNQEFSFSLHNGHL